MMDYRPGGVRSGQSKTGRTILEPVTHQTVKLGKGKHSSPEDGACVMELASMLAGEEFSDHPDCVCPVIGSFLRAYNDSVGDERRQDLYAYAAKVVNSRSIPEVERARTERLMRWSAERATARWTRFLVPPRFPALTFEPEPDSAGGRAVRAIKRHTARSHAQALALIDELLTIGPRRRVAHAPVDSDMAVEVEL
jgi:hypothetical protein